MKKLLLFATLFLSFGFFAQNFSGGQEIVKNVKNYSPSKSYYLIFQNDGNLVLYKTRNNTSVWNSRTSDVGNKAIFQTDGNLVIYNRSNKPIYATNTENRGAVLRIQDDGNLVIYNSNNGHVWSSQEDVAQNGTEVSAISPNVLKKGFKFTVDEKIYSKNRKFYLIFQLDGNLVIYSNNGGVVWDAKTGERGARAEFQKDGNLVVYNRRGQALFATNTSDGTANSAMMQDDGNLVVYDARNNALWASDGNR